MEIGILSPSMSTTCMFKIDLIVWKLDLLDAHKDETFEFKIDLIVWK